MRVRFLFRCWAGAGSPCQQLQSWGWGRCQSSLGPAVNFSVDTGWANSHQPVWQQWSMNSKHHRQFQMCLCLMVQAVTMRGSWDIYTLHTRPTGCREFRKYCAVESEDDATVVLSVRWKSQHYAKGKMRGLAGKGNGLVHWLSLRVPDWLANMWLALGLHTRCISGSSST